MAAAGAPAAGGQPTDPCAGAGCAPPPLCSTGCTERCGCCPCTDGERSSLAAGGAKVCRGGCYIIEPEADADVPSCTYGGMTYPSASAFYADDDCNVCTCGAGQVSCTKKTCPPCDPSTDDHRHGYIGKTPMECQTIHFKCAPNTMPFQNACGCGCQQAASCPEFFDCEPTPGGPGCDTNMLMAMCPYSGIAF